MSTSATADTTTGGVSDRVTATAASPATHSGTSSFAGAGVTMTAFGASVTGCSSPRWTLTTTRTLVVTATTEAEITDSVPGPATTWTNGIPTASAAIACSTSRLGVSVTRDAWLTALLGQDRNDTIGEFAHDRVYRRLRVPFHGDWQHHVVDARGYDLTKAVDDLLERPR
jgi:hypothetical protein